ncbi:hypothetical protein HBA54_23775 [Pelagibius litoralis]|uniref:Peptidoglycan binding-like domain-containing protein n=1 Tax=Pelagibius litoralis TaxID=374515 RepID=A0A967F2A9_9PROT|nr:peptidoglycan-binding domain-containing protein [Pelagibius litoralis]NIA71616.1 hypothetical protein [Pelagibius litoralis]
MSEQTEKASQNPRKAAAGKRPPRKSRSPGAKTTAKRHGQEKGTQGTGPKKAADAMEKPKNSLAPDPATITFGSNRPIVPPPPPKPVSSGLRFSGPSAGTLKASGPQATSAKANGLTFTDAAPEETKSTTAPQAPRPPKAPETKTGKPPSNKAATAKSGTKPPQDGKKPDGAATAKANSGKANPDGEKTPAKPAGITKPAIAPQQAGPLIEKTPSRRPATYALLGFAAVAGLTWWFSNQPVVEPQQGSGEIAALQDPAPGNPAAGQAAVGPTEAPGAGDSGSTPAPAQASAPASDAVTIAELWEIQDILRQLDLAPGTSNGQLTPATRDAIRSYQEMAGLAVTGEASPALLQELRSVAALYNGG